MKGRPVKDGDPPPVLRPGLDLGTLNERPSRKGRRRSAADHSGHVCGPSMKGRPVKDGDLAPELARALLDGPQ